MTRVPTPPRAEHTRPAGREVLAGAHAALLGLAGVHGGAALFDLMPPDRLGAFLLAGTLFALVSAASVHVALRPLTTAADRVFNPRVLSVALSRADVRTLFIAFWAAAVLAVLGMMAIFMHAPADGIGRAIAWAFSLVWAYFFLEGLLVHLRGRMPQDGAATGGA